MSITQPANREELKAFCLRQLGAPVMKINIDDEQVNDAVELAFEFWNEFHFNGTERTYVKHQITAEDVTNQYIPVNDNIIGISRILPGSTGYGNIGMFDIRYQLRLNDMWDLSSTSYVNYEITMEHLAMMDMIFNGAKPIEFNRLTNKLYIRWDWSTDAIVGDYIILEGYVITDPVAYTKVWNDRMLKKLATAYVKRQWGSNSKKYGGMQLPGGVTIQGQQIYDEAQADIISIEKEIRDTYESPPIFQVG